MLLALYLLFILAASTPFLAAVHAQHVAHGRTYSDVDTISHQRVGIVLGCIKVLSNGRFNLEFVYQGTGNIDDLEILPHKLKVGMGVLDLRGESRQTVNESESIATEGADMISPSRIALNPDCGFAPAGSL